MPLVVPAVDRQSAASAKIALFRSLFRGRDDVYPRRFESRKTGKSGYAPACANEWVRGICEKPRIKCAVCPHRRFLPVTDDVIRWHLSGRDGEGQPFVAGVYPLLLDETCYFLAVDFDKAGWQADAVGVPARLPTSGPRRQPSSDRDRAEGDTSGCSSRRSFPPSWHADSGHISSPRRWRIVLTSGWTPTTDYSRVKTPCRKVVSET